MCEAITSESYSHSSAVKTGPARQKDGPLKGMTDYLLHEPIDTEEARSLSAASAIY